VDPLLDAVTARQYGLVTHAQARSVGLSESAIRHRITRGDWVRIRAGLYLRAGLPTSWRQAVLASVLSGGPHATASHATAATLWGFSGFEAHPIEITVPLTRRPRLESIRVHRSGTLADADLREVGAIPVLSPARTIVDISSRLDEHRLGAMIDDGLRRKVLSLPALHSVARRLPTIAPGRSPQRVARLLAARTAGFHPGDSELESTVLRVLVDAGLPPPVRQFRVVIHGHVYFLDLAYPEPKLAIEVDGYDFHRGREVFDRDRSRQNDLVGAGWTVLRFTSQSTPDEIVSAVSQFLFGRSSSS